VQFSPRVHERLVEHVAHADVDRLSIAEVWRSTRAHAWRCGLAPPGYHTVRVLVQAERERRAALRSVVVDAIDELWAYPGPGVTRLVDQARATRRG
jgi:hypothetical protein